MIFAQNGFGNVVTMEDTREPSFRLQYFRGDDRWVAWCHSIAGKSFGPSYAHCPKNWFQA